MMPALAHVCTTSSLCICRRVDVVIIAFYFALVLAIGFYLTRPGEHRRRFFHGRTRDDGLGRRLELSLRQSGRA